MPAKWKLPRCPWSTTLSTAVANAYALIQVYACVMIAVLPVGFGLAALVFVMAAHADLGKPTTDVVERQVRQETRCDKCRRDGGMAI